MIGALSLEVRGWLSGVSTAALVALCVSLGATIGPAAADKVGVAAAVNPDAFSSLAGAPQSQINIGKSIFYNERINTTGSGLVQVLLVDGSTFTVGPGSNLVIDKFVYDPNKGTGQITASFSKGVMRFVGGKISKNEGGVTVGTPAGALAIRGGIAYADFKSPKNFSVLFVFGDYIKLQGQTVWQPGYGLFSNNGVVTNRPFNATDLAGIMVALTNGNPGTGKSDNPSTNTVKLLNTQSLNQLISDANANQIQAQVNEQLASQTKGEATPTLSQGYAAGIFQQQIFNGDQQISTNQDQPVGTLSNLSPSEVALLFNAGGTFSGGSFSLFVDGGVLEKGGAKILFSPISLPAEIPGLPQVNLFAGGATGEVPGAITVYDNTIPTNTGPQLDVPGQLNSGQAVLVGVSGQGQAFCASCNFLNWGAWLADVDFQTNQGENGSLTHQVHVAGWWVSGDLPTIGQLPLQGTATYSGTTYGTVAELANSGWVTRTATGGVQMNWDFGQRAGNLAIKNFDANGQLYGPLNVQGRMDVPGQLANSATNKFSGPLLGTLGVDQHVPNIGGVAAGSFAANGADKTAGVTGNFAVGNSYYKASGIFGAGRDGAVDPNGHLELPPATQ